LRTFIAIEFPSEILRKIEKIINYFKSLTPEASLKWVATENLHLTIKFIGDFPEDNLAQLKSTINESLQDVRQFTISVEGLGMYPSGKRPRVIWLGISQADPIIEIHQKLDDALQTLNVKPDHRKFSAHLTIARVRRRTEDEVVAEIGKTLSEFKVGSLGEAKIDKFHLFQSELTPKGPIYTPLLTISLNQV